MCHSLKEDVISAASATQRLLSLRDICVYSPEAVVCHLFVGAYKLKTDVSYPYFHFELLSHLEKLQRLNSSITVKFFFLCIVLNPAFSFLLRLEGYLPLEKLAFRA